MAGSGLPPRHQGYEAVMSADPATNGPNDGAGPTAAAPSGTNAVVVHSDLRCPWARVAVHRFLGVVDSEGMGSELVVDHRWFPLGDDAMPDDPDAVDRKLEPLRSLEAGLDWHRWSDGDTAFPRDSRPAAAWVQGAKQVSPAASVALDRALRDALFAGGRDISDASMIEEVAGTVDGLDVDDVRAEVESGRPDAELDRQAELAGTDAVPVSPTIVLGDGTTWANPGIESRTEDGIPVIESDDPSVYAEIVDAYRAQRHYD